MSKSITRVSFSDTWNSCSSCCQLKEMQNYGGVFPAQSSEKCEQRGEPQKARKGCLRFFMCLFNQPQRRLYPQDPEKYVSVSDWAHFFNAADPLWWFGLRLFHQVEERMTRIESSENLDLLQKCGG